MALTKYVSAEWVEPTLGGSPSIKAIGDDGLEYWLPGDDPAKYDVPPFPAFRETEEGQALLAAKDSISNDTPPPDQAA